jgi:hypothetical protein
MLSAYKNELVEAEKLAAIIKSELEAKESSRLGLQIKVDTVGVSIKRSTDEIVRLEELLSIEKQKLQGKCKLYIL